MAAKPCAIFYQTNGMGSAWWTAPATVRTAAALSGSSTNAVTNVVAATFTPAMDPGATGINGFLGSTGDIYRAAFTLRFRHGPGETPNALPIPPQTINWANVANVNADSAPFVVKGGSGGLTPTDVTNIVDGVVASSNLASVAYVDTSSETTLASANAYTTTVSNKFDTAIGSLNNATNDLTAKVEAKFDSEGDHDSYVSWNGVYFDVYAPMRCEEEITFISGWDSLYAGSYESPTSLPAYLSGNSVTNGGAVAAAQAMTNDATIVRGDFDGDAWDIKVSYAKFLTNQIGWSEIDPSTTPTTISGYGITDAYTKSQTETASTNAATSVVSNYLDYALVPLSGTSVNLASGEIGNLSLSSEQTDLTVNLDFSAAADRSGDCMLYLVNEADTDMNVGPSSVITIGWDGADIKAGTNVVMFTRIKREGDNSLVMVSTKEIK